MHVYAAGLLVDGPRFLLARRRVDLAWYPGVWDLPGGHLDGGETPEQALRRELDEELGVTVTACTPRPGPWNGEDFRGYLFRVDGWRGHPVNAAPQEHDRVGWFTTSDLPGLHLADDRYPALLDDLLSLHPPPHP